MDIRPVRVLVHSRAGRLFGCPSEGSTILDWIPMAENVRLCTSRRTRTDWMSSGRFLGGYFFEYSVSHIFETFATQERKETKSAVHQKYNAPWEQTAKYSIVANSMNVNVYQDVPLWVTKLKYLRLDLSSLEPLRTRLRAHHLIQKSKAHSITEVFST